MPAQRRVMLEALLGLELAQRDEPATTSQVAAVTRYPTSTTRRYLQELAAVGLVDRLHNETPGHSDRWQRSQALRDLLTAMQSPMEEGERSSSVRRGEISG